MTCLSFVSFFASSRPERVLEDETKTTPGQAGETGQRGCGGGRIETPVMLDGEGVKEAFEYPPATLTRKTETTIGVRRQQHNNFRCCFCCCHLQLYFY